MNRAYYKSNPYSIIKGHSINYVDYNTVIPEVNISLKNSKTGNVLAFNLSPETSCDHRCECYKGYTDPDTGKNIIPCYACGGCYNFSSNQAIYAENLAFFLKHTSDEFIDEMVKRIKAHKLRKLFRWFTSGDILNKRFFRCMIEIARRCPSVKFWTYTKKYGIVNAYVREYGLDAIPENFTIVFSHWLNNDGTYFPMDNPFAFPTSEFIPLGMEKLAESATHICPCSDPDSLETCETCEHACHTLKHGESMALLEHSTERTKDRDKALHDSKAAKAAKAK